MPRKIPAFAPLRQAARGIFHESKSLGQKLFLATRQFLRVIDRREFSLPGIGLGPHLVIRERFELLVERVDLAHDRLHAPDFALILRPEYLL